MPSGRTFANSALVELTAALAGPSEINAATLRFAAGEPDGDAAPSPPMPSQPGSLDHAIAALKTRMIQDVLEETAGNQSVAARRLGISRARLIKKLAPLKLR